MGQDSKIAEVIILIGHQRLTKEMIPPKSHLVNRWVFISVAGKSMADLVAAEPLKSLTLHG